MSDTYPVHGVIVAIDESRQEMFIERPCEGRMIIQPSHWNYEQARDWMDRKCVVFVIGAPAVGLPLLMHAQVKALEWDEGSEIINIPSPTVPPMPMPVYMFFDRHNLQPWRFTRAFWGLDDAKRLASPKIWYEQPAPDDYQNMNARAWISGSGNEKIIEVRPTP